MKKTDLPSQTHIDMADAYGLNTKISKAEYLELRKVNLNGLLNSYADEADVFAEIIQNAFDTVKICLGQQKYTGENPPCIKIFIGRRNSDLHYFAVKDNGLGMNPETFDKFTIPGFTKNKKRGKTIGYKGVGASFFFASSEKIAIKTIDVQNTVSEMTVKNSYSWIVNETGVPPTIETTADFPQLLKDSINIEQGTTICYYFHAGAKPKNLTGLTDIEDGDRDRELTNWVSYLCSKTALGQIYDMVNDNIQVKVHLDDGNAVFRQDWTFNGYNKELKKLGYPFPWKVFANCTETSEIDSKTPAQLIKYMHLSQGVHRVWKKTEIEEEDLKFTEDEAALVSEHLDFVDVFYCWSTSVLTEVNRRLGATKKNKPSIRYGIKLIVDGVPQGRMIDFDTTSDQGLGRQTHMVFSFRELKMDDGRKIASDENIQEVIRKISVRLMRLIQDYKPYLKLPQREPVAEALDEWKNRVASQISDSIVRILFEKLGKIAPIHIDPSSESDVIALFTSLVSNGLLKGYKLLAVSGYARYDGLINIEKTNDLRDGNDPFSIRDIDLIQDGKYRVVEFKQQFADLVENFYGKKTKFPAEINLAVCWNLPQINQNVGEITYCYDDKKDYRPLYGVTHIWRHDFNTIPIISLKHFVANYLAMLEGNEPKIGRAILAELVHQDTENSI